MKELVDKKLSALLWAEMVVSLYLLAMGFVLPPVINVAIRTWFNVSDLVVRSVYTGFVLLGVTAVGVMLWRLQYVGIKKVIKRRDLVLLSSGALAFVCFLYIVTGAHLSTFHWYFRVSHDANVSGPIEQDIGDGITQYLYTDADGVHKFELQMDNKWLSIIRADGEELRWETRFAPDRLSVDFLRRVTLPNGQPFVASVGTSVTADDGTRITISRSDPVDCVKLVMPEEGYVTDGVLGLTVTRTCEGEVSTLFFGIFCILQAFRCAGAFMTVCGICMLFMTSIRKIRAKRAARPLG